MQFRALATVVWLSLFSTLAASAAELAGALPGQFSVDEQGLATYTVPIEVPPGTNGMQPDLSLVYHSTNTPGRLGTGWNLIGLSAIMRCRARMEPDGFNGAVDFDANDRFCIDGERLIAVNGPYGAPGTEYRTERDVFSKVISNGAVASGPASFTVYTKDGRMLSYGTTDDSQIGAQGTGGGAMVWGLARAEDRFGNAMRVQYFENQTQTEFYPIRIDYTENPAAGLSAYASVVFNYEDRPDKSRGMIGGTTTYIRVRLANIQTFAEGALVRDYRLAYGEDPLVSKSRLESITVCGENDCIRPTRFEWEDGRLTLWGGKSLPEEGHGLNGWGSLIADYNGDGLADMLWNERDEFGRSKADVVYWPNTGDAVFDSFQNRLPSKTAINEHAARLGDFDGDGLQDVLWYHAETDGRAKGAMRIWRSSADAADPAPFFVEVPAPGSDVTGFHPAVADFDGDGLADVLWYKRSTGDRAVGYSRGMVNGEFSFDAYSNCIPDASTLANQTPVVGDFNGDGMADVLWNPTGNGTRTVWLSKGRQTDGGPCFETTSSDPLRPIQDPAGYNLAGYQPIPSDFNGDGLTDILWTNRSLGYITLWTSGGDASFDSTSIPTPQGQSYVDFAAYPVDFNADGSADVLWEAVDLYGRATGTRRLWMSTAYISSSDGPFDFDASYAPGQGRFIEYRPSFGDFNGNGMPDIFWDMQDTKGRSSGARSLWANRTPYPDRISRIIDGFGVRVDVEYGPLTDASMYSKYGDAVYPYVDVQSGRQLVRRISQSDGVGRMRDQRFMYAGLQAHRLGRGELGFASRTVIDESTGIEVTTFYDQQHPTDGMPLETERRLADGTLIERISNTYEVQEFDGATHFFVGLIESVREGFEIDGTPVVTTTTTQDFDAFGNVTRLSTLSDDGYGEITTSTYENDASSWLIGMVTRTEVTGIAPEVDPITRTAVFENDPVTGLRLAETVEPSLMYARRTEFTYDPTLGLPVSTTVSGYRVDTRVGSVSYDDKGRFAVQQTNALGHTETGSFDPGTGRPLSQTDINGLVTRFEYDELGQPTRITFPDGIQRTIERSFSAPGYPPESITNVVTSQPGVPTRTVYFDWFGREVRTETFGLNHRMIVTLVEFDALGRVERSTKPFFDGEGKYWKRFQYDVLGRVTQETLPDGSVVTHSYNGFTTVDTNDHAQSHTQTTNSRGQVIRVFDDNGSSNQYRYDGFGNLLTVTDAYGSVTSMTYDIFGQKTEMTTPDSGTTRYRYDSFGQLIRQRSENRKTIRYDYDVLGRVIKRRESGGRTSWEYDAAANGVGLVSAIGSRQGRFERTFVYDDLSRVSDMHTQIGQQNLSVSMTYDALGRVSHLTYPTGFQVERSFDADGYLVSVARAGGFAPYWQAMASTAEGQVNQFELGNGLTTERIFDPASGRVQAIATGAGSEVDVQNLGYFWDFLGNLFIRTDYNQGLVEGFNYDNLNRLTTSVLNGSQITNYAYDAVGNLTYKSDVGSYTYGNGAGPHAVTATSGALNAAFQYDQAGNMIRGDSIQRIRYNAAQKPVYIVDLTKEKRKLYYGPDRELIRQTVHEYSGEFKDYDKYHLGRLFERVLKHGENDEDLHYIYAGNELVAIHTESSTGAADTKYVHADHLGSVDVITDDFGRVIERNSFDPHGKRRNFDWSSAPIGTLASVVSRGFTGHESLDSLGLVHMGGRVYNPLLGRFLTPDPTVQFPFSTQGLNRYTYVNNNPLSFIDPTGFGLGRFFKKIGRFFERIFKQIVAPVTAAIVAIVAGPIIGAFVGAFVGTLVNGGSIKDAFRAGAFAAVGAGTALVASAIGKQVISKLSGRQGGLFSGPDFKTGKAHLTINTGGQAASDAIGGPNHIAVWSADSATKKAVKRKSKDRSGPSAEASASAGVGLGAAVKVQASALGEFEAEAIIADRLKATVGTEGNFAGEVIEMRVALELQLGPLELKGALSIVEESAFSDFGRDPSGLDRFLDRLKRLDFRRTGGISKTAALNRKVGFKAKTFLGLGASVEGSVTP